MRFKLIQLQAQEATANTTTKNVGDELPIDYREQRPIPAIIFLLIVGLIFGGLGAKGLYQALQQGSIGGEAAPIGVFILVGGGALWLAVYSFGSLHLQIDTCRVQCQLLRRFWFNTIWESPLSDFEGILQEEIYHKNSKPSRCYTEYLLTLLHKYDKRKKVVLYSAETSVEFRDHAEKFSRLLNVPLLRSDGCGGFDIRYSNELDLSLQERTSSSPAFSSSGSPPPGNLITVDQQGDVFQAVIKLTRISYYGLPFILIGLTVAYFSGTGVSSVARLAFGVMFALIGSATVVFGLITKEKIKVDQYLLQHELLILDKPLISTSMQLRDIEEVTIAKPYALTGASLRVFSDHSSMVFGSALSRKETIWLKDRLTALISR